MARVLRRREAALEIDPRLLEGAARHARRALPEECCGVLVGRREADGGACVEEVEEAANVWPGGRAERYEIAPETLLAVHKAARRRGLEVVGYYHSHPRGPARPSDFDRRRAWPDTLYLIVTPRGEARAWRLAGRGGGWVEMPIAPPPGVSFAER